LRRRADPDVDEEVDLLARGLGVEDVGQPRGEVGVDLLGVVEVDLGGRQVGHRVGAVDRDHDMEHVARGAGGQVERGVERDVRGGGEVVSDDDLLAFGDLHEVPPGST
jgi:hypothetical protein